MLPSFKLININKRNDNYLLYRYELSYEKGNSRNNPILCDFVSKNELRKGYLNLTDSFSYLLLKNEASRKYNHTELQ